MNLTTVRWLGYAGLIPFFVSALGHLAGLPTRGLGLAYGAVILSFLGEFSGGRHCWLTSKKPIAHVDSSPVFAFPGGLVALFLAPPFAHALLLGGCGVQWLYDNKHAFVSRWPEGFVELRTHLTLGACLAILLMWL